MIKRLEAFSLCLYAVTLFYIIITGRYGLYMNPKYLWLTFLSSFLVLIYGIYGIIYPASDVKKIRLAVLIIFILMTAIVPARELGADDMLYPPF